MTKLKRKIFVLLMSMLTVIALVITVSFNVQSYRAEYRDTENKLAIIEDNRNGEFEKGPGAKGPESDGPKPDWQSRDVRFVDSAVYSVILNEDNSVKDVISRSNSDESTDSVKELAETYLASHSESVKEVGNLYTSQYSYSLASGRELTIVDNSSVMEKLRNQLKLSVMIFALAELVIYLVVRLLTKWIVRPVQESFDKQRQFIADASHELKTPLTVIMASADALSDSGEEKWLDNIKSESERMDKLVKSLLDLAESEDAISSAILEEGDLSRLIWKSALTFEGLMFEKNIALDCDIEDGVIIEMDVDRMTELMGILLDNAIKHSTGDSVKVSLHRVGQDVVLSVVNAGEGINPGEEERIFERFYRSDASRNRDENRYGLGLAIAKNIAMQHGGSIRAWSKDGVTTFEVKL